MHVICWYPSQRRHKLDNNSVECIFSSYIAEIIGYQFYDPLTSKLVVSHDVIQWEMILGLE